MLTIVSLAYYDFDDYEDPVKYFIDTKMYFTLVSGFTKVVNAYVRNNYAEQSDSIFQFQPSSNKNSFINIEDYVTNLKKDDKNETVFLINYIKDSKSITYQRSVLTFLD